MNLLFVYGTLKRCGHNQHFMAGQSFQGAARTVAGYTLYDLGGYPGLVGSPDNAEGVSGEVWSVDDECLAGLDVLEGTSHGLYRRETVPLRPPFGERRVEAYVYAQSVRDRPHAGAEWKT